MVCSQKQNNDLHEVVKLRHLKKIIFSTDCTMCNTFLCLASLNINLFLLFLELVNKLDYTMVALTMHSSISRHNQSQICNVIFYIQVYLIMGLYLYLITLAIEAISAI